MAYKQIYIKESDVALFEEAERYGDSLSRVISEALKDFVDKKRKELDEEGYGEIEISVGTFPNNIEVKKFRGKKLATCKELQFSKFNDHSDEELRNLAEAGWIIRESPNDDETKITWTIFSTKKGKYVVWREAEVEGYDPYEEVGNSHRINGFQVIDTIPGKKENYLLKFGDTKTVVPPLLLQRALTAANIIKEEWLDL